MGGHSTALERLGRVYLRYRETIPAAVQCFFKSVETNPSNHVAWYLLGRCYMATAQYSDACEAYNRAINLCPNDPQVWCSLGVLYYAFGQYRESLGMLARALKLDPTMADAWYNVGALYDMCDQPEDAQQAYMKARENGLADRFARAGMGLNPLAMQSMGQQYAPSAQPTSSQSQAQPAHHSSHQQGERSGVSDMLNEGHAHSSQHHQQASSLGQSHPDDSRNSVDDHDHLISEEGEGHDIMTMNNVDAAVADYMAGTGDEDDDDEAHPYHH